MSTQQKLGELLKERRQSLGLTQKQTADRAGIKIQQYQKFESGDRDLANSSFRLACQVVTALEFDVSKFYLEHVEDAAKKGI